MTSARKIAANRQNARKSRGPRSGAAKSMARRNAVRHGLAALVHRQPVSETEIDRFAKALCGSDADPILFEQARIIAQLRHPAATLAADLRDPTCIDETERCPRGCIDYAQSIPNEEIHRL
jgi:hypothetical protein